MHDYNIDDKAPTKVPVSTDISQPVPEDCYEALRELNQESPGTWTPDLGDQVDSLEQPLKGRLRQLLNPQGFGSLVRLDGTSDDDFHKAFFAVVRQSKIRRAHRLQKIADMLRPGRVFRTVNAQGKEEVTIECTQLQYIDGELLTVDKGIGRVTLLLARAPVGKRAKQTARITDTFFEVRSGVLDANPQGNFTEEQAVEAMKKQFEQRYGAAPRAVDDVKAVCKFYQPVGSLVDHYRKSYTARVLGVDSKGQGQTPEYMFATDLGEIVSENIKARRFGPKKGSGSSASGSGDAVVKTFIQIPTRDKPLEDQLVDAAIPGVPLTSKVLPVVDNVYFYFQDEEGKQNTIKQNDDGTFNFPVSSAAFLAMVNVQNVLEGINRNQKELGYPAFSKPLLVGLNQAKVSDNGYADTKPPEEIDHQELADLLGLTLEQVKNSWTVQIGQGTGNANGGLEPRMGLDEQVIDHECVGGHITIFQYQENFPHGPHEGMSDDGATNEGWLRQDEHGTFSAASVKSCWLGIGMFAAGPDFQGISKKKGELRDGEEIVLASAFSMDPHKKGLTYFGAMGKTKRTWLSEHLDALVAKFGSNRGALNYCRKLSKSQVEKAPGERTTFQDLATIGLNTIEKDFESGALRDALVAEYVHRWEEVGVSLKKISSNKEIDEAIETSRQAMETVRKRASEAGKKAKAA